VDCDLKLVTAKEEERRGEKKVKYVSKLAYNAEWKIGGNIGTSVDFSKHL
jgi:hypothetical protein